MNITIHPGLKLKLLSHLFDLLQGDTRWQLNGLQEIGCRLHQLQPSRSSLRSTPARPPLTLSRRPHPSSHPLASQKAGDSFHHGRAPVAAAQRVDKRLLLFLFVAIDDDDHPTAAVSTA